MFTPIGVGGRLDRRRRRRRWPAITVVVLAVVLVSAATSWWFVFREPAGSSAAVPPRCPKLKPTAAALVEPAKVQVNIYNSTKRIGLAADVSKKLAARGYSVDEVANDPLERSIPGVAEVRYGQAGIDEARTIVAVVPGGRLVPLARKDAKVDLSLGERFEALARRPVPPKVTPSPRPGC